MPSDNTSLGQGQGRKGSAEFACKEVRLSAIILREGARGVGKDVVDVSLAVVLQSPLENDSRGFDEV